MADPAIVAEGLSKRFGDVTALDGVDLELPTGGVLGVLGPNGAGKTTAVRILATLLKPDRGRAWVGLSLDKVIVQLPARRRIGVTAYAAYARAADLGYGIAFYAAVGVGAAVLTVPAFAAAASAGSTRGGDRAAGRSGAVAPSAQRHDGAGRAHHVPHRPGRG